MRFCSPSCHPSKEVSGDIIALSLVTHRAPRVVLGTLRTSKSFPCAFCNFLYFSHLFIFFSRKQTLLWLSSNLLSYLGCCPALA